MTVQKSDGTRLTKASIVSDMLTEVTQQKVYTVNEDVFETFDTEGQASRFESQKRLRFRAGQRIRQADIDAAFPAASVKSVTPAAGLAAGGTKVTVKGTNFGGATGASLGGTAVTNFKVTSYDTITFTAPAHAAGQVNLVIQDDSGDVTKTNAYTYQ